jgi:outer membrane immunogenic protein
MEMGLQRVSGGLQREMCSASVNAPSGFGAGVALRRVGQMRALRNFVAGAAIAGAAWGLAAGPASAERWGGIYIGATAGWIGSDIDTSWPNRVPQTLTGSFTHEDDGAVFTGLVGIQTQVNQFVLGVEANFGGKAFDSDGFDTGSPGTGCPSAAFSCSARTNGLLFTVGPRLGWAFNEKWMAFITGGYATWNVETRSNVVATGAAFDSTRQRHDGWFIGGGIEYAINRNLIIGLEYQHLELDSQRHISSASGVVDTNTRDVDVTADIVRARLSFKLGRPETIAEDPLK